MGVTYPFSKDRFLADIPPHVFEALVWPWRTPWIGCSDYGDHHGGMPAFTQDDVISCVDAGETIDYCFTLGEGERLWWSPRDHCMRVSHFCVHGVSDPIRLIIEPPDDRAIVEDGNHRALACLTMGWNIPTEVIAYQSSELRKLDFEAYRTRARA